MLKKIGSLMGKLKLRVTKPVIKRRYAKWQSVKRGKKIAVIASFVLVLVGGIVGVNFLNNANAAWNNLITWSSKADFDNNAITTGGATTNTSVDTTTSSGDAQLAYDATGKGSTVAFGTNHTLVVKSDGTLWASGANDVGQLGTGGFSTRLLSFTQVATGVAFVEASGNQSLMIKQDGTLWATGSYNTGYGLGVGSGNLSSWTNTGLTNVKTVSTYSGTSIAVKNDGTVWGTGSGSWGWFDASLANYTSWVQISDASLAKVGSVQVVSAEVAVTGSFALKSDGILLARGNRVSGTLGLGACGYVAVGWTQAATNVKKVVAGGNGTFIIKNDGTVFGTGTSDTTSLGIVGNPSGVCGFTQSNITNVNDISRGSDYSIAVKNDNSVWVVGVNTYGRLGLGDTTTRAAWTQVSTTGVISQVNIGAGSMSAFLKSDGSLYLTGDNLQGQLGLGTLTPSNLTSFTNIINSVKEQANYYAASGTISGYKINAGNGNVYNWNSISWTGTTPANTAIKFRARGATSEAGLTSASWSSYYVSSGASLQGIADSQWLEVEMTLTTTSNGVTPVLNDFSVNYYTDFTAPTYTGGLASSWTGSNKSTPITNNSFGNAAQPYFEFPAATDDVGGSGVAGYYVYFGTTISADPFTAGVYQAHVAGVPQTFTPSAISNETTYYLHMVAVDNAGNKSSAATLFTYKYDKTNPISPSNITVSPFGYSPTNSFNFSWNTGFDELNSPSGLAGYQYKVCGDVNDWSSYTITQSLSVNGLTACRTGTDGDGNPIYQNGQNTFYIRSIDNAGNLGNVSQINYFFNGLAPSAPRNITVNPQNNTTSNSFTFTWDVPETTNRPIKGYRYSSNTVPDDNSTFINITKSPLPGNVTLSTNPQTGLTMVTLSNIPAATRTGNNLFYVVAVDAEDNVSYGVDNVAQIGFSCVVAAPGAPVGLDLFDTSKKKESKYSVALSWLEPAQVGIGISRYDIYRSVDGQYFGAGPIGTSTSTSYIDNGTASIGLQSIEYFYKVIAVDSSNNTSDSSSIVSIIPTGRYTEPPIITVKPTASAKVSTASVRWVTDRFATSSVEYGETTDLGSSTANQDWDITVDHVVNIAGLKPDTTYYYKVGYQDEDGNKVNSKDNAGYSEIATFHTQPAPRVERVSIQDVRLYTAVLTWYTSEPATSDLLYGKTSNYANNLTNVSGGATTVHSVRLDNLEHSSTYHFAIRITDSDGNQIMSDDYSFDTQQYPKLSNVRFQPMADQSTSTFKVTWDSNVPTTSVVEFQPEGGKVQEAVKTKLETKHEIIVSGLLDNTYYLIKTIGVDQYGNQVVSDTNRVKTDFDTRPPVLSNIAVEISNTDFGMSAKSQLVISWETDEPSTSQVEYGFGVIGDDYNIKSQEDSTLTTSHVLVLTDLRPSSSYHLRAVSKDASGNVGISEEQSILTEQARSSVLDIIVGSLQSSLGWLFGMSN